MPDLTLPHLGFTLDHPREKAVGTFYARFGMMPEHVVEDHGVLWVGPIPQPAGPEFETAEFEALEY